MSHYLSVVVFGPGDNPAEPSHWAFALHDPGFPVSELHHVLAGDSPKVIYHFDKRKDIDPESTLPQGHFVVASLSREACHSADDIISREPAPKDGKDHCQHWVQNCVIALEIEEVIPDGTSHWLAGLVDKPASEVKRKTGKRWANAV